MAEAMFLGKPVIATGYSGNLDFMDRNNSCLVDYQLVPLRDEQYLFASGQVWADPDLDQAVHYVLHILDEPDFGWRLGLLASRHVRTTLVIWPWVCGINSVWINCYQKFRNIRLPIILGFPSLLFN